MGEKKRGKQMGLGRQRHHMGGMEAGVSSVRSAKALVLPMRRGRDARSMDERVHTEGGSCLMKPRLTIGSSPWSHHDRLKFRGHRNRNRLDVTGRRPFVPLLIGDVDAGRGDWRAKSTRPDDAIFALVAMNTAGGPSDTLHKSRDRRGPVLRCCARSCDGHSQQRPTGTAEHARERDLDRHHFGRYEASVWDKYARRPQSRRWAS